MELRFEKNKSCRLAARGKWGNLAAAWMGLSFFLRMVYYFGLMNFNDLGGSEIAFRVVLPLVVSVVFILMLKVRVLGIPLFAGIVACVYAVNYFLAEDMGFGGLVSGILVLVCAVLILLSALGYVRERRWLIWAGLVSLLFRVVFVDVFGYLLPLTELDLAAYIPMASNLFGVCAVSYLCSAMRLRKGE